MVLDQPDRFEASEDQELDLSGGAESPRLLSWQANSTGSITLSLAVAPHDVPRFAFEDRFGNVHTALPRSSTRSAAENINLLRAADREQTWSVEGSKDSITLGRDFNERQKLRDETTFFITSKREQEDGLIAGRLQFIDPITGGATPIEPLHRYSFSLLAALHRCTARVRLEIRDTGGHLLATEVRDVRPNFRGGETASSYDNVAIDFMAPDAADSLTIFIEKGRTENRQNSYLFFARPSLMTGSSAAAQPTHVLPVSLLRFFRSTGNLEVLRAVVPAPPDIFEGRQAQATLLIITGGRPIRLPSVTLEHLGAVEITALGVENSGVEFSGRVGDEATENVELGVFVDGELSASTVAEIADRSFRGTVMLAPQHLDGRPHFVEVRTLPQHETVAHTTQMLPFQITPWDALRNFGGSPLDGTMAPAAGHHLRAYRKWAEHAGAETGRDIPPLARLHDELLQGFKKRNAYPPLKFTRYEQPVVSVIIPVHDKFEVTYFCACALLFAYNETSFEVIVVDDGSTDETRAIDMILSGITVLRHESAQGFVRSCNDGAAVARGRYVAFLNNDTEPTAGWLDELVAAFEGFDSVGLAGSKLLYPNGRLQEAGGIVWRSGNPWNVGRSGNASEPRFNYLRQVDYLSGAAILLRRDLWQEVGGFSEEFAPGYFEDTDLAMKVRAAGKLVLYVPTSVVYHFEGQSSGTDVNAGMKRFQEVNRPKFKRKWSHLYGSHGEEGRDPDREKDRNISFRVLFIDQRVPSIDADGGSYAVFQELRLLQSLGAKVTFLPRNLAWMDRHTLALQRIGVECLHAPFVTNFVEYCRLHAGEYDVAYVDRYKIGEEIIPAIRQGGPKVKVILNLVDLHFLRELREAVAETPGHSFERAVETREAELAVIRASDLTLSYTDVEIAVLQSHLAGTARVGKVPWVLDIAEQPRRPFDQTRDLLFLGGFGHPPNIGAVRFFATEVMPKVRQVIPDAVFNIVGSNAKPEVLSLASDSVRIFGYVADLDEVFAATRLFVAPLLAGAGIKGKVLEAMSRGVPSVLSPVAAEGTGLMHESDCLIAKSADEWAAAVVRLYNDERLWSEIGDRAKQTARNRYSMQAGIEEFRDAFAQIEIYGRPGAHYNKARPERYGW